MNDGKMTSQATGNYVFLDNLIAGGLLFQLTMDQEVCLRQLVF